MDIFKNTFDVIITPTDYGKQLVLSGGTSASFIGGPELIHSNRVSIGFNLLHYIDDLIYQYYATNSGFTDLQRMIYVIHNQTLLTGTSALMLDKYASEFQQIKDLVEIYYQNNDKKHIEGLISYFDSNYMLPLMQYLHQTLIPARVSVSNNAIIIKDNSILIQKAVSPFGDVENWLYDVEKPINPEIVSKLRNFIVERDSDFRTFANSNNTVKEIKNISDIVASHNNTTKNIDKIFTIISNNMNFQTLLNTKLDYRDRIVIYNYSVTSCVFANQVNNISTTTLKNKVLYDFSDIASNVTIKASTRSNNYDIRWYNDIHQLEMSAWNKQYSLENYRYRVLLPTVKLYNPNRAYSYTAGEKTFSLLSISTSNASIDSLEYDKYGNITSFSYYASDNPIYFTLSALDVQMGIRVPSLKQIDDPSASAIGCSAYMAKVQSLSGRWLMLLDDAGWNKLLSSASADFFSFYPVRFDGVTITADTGTLTGKSFFAVHNPDYIFEKGFQTFEVIDYYYSSSSVSAELNINSENLAGKWSGYDTKYSASISSVFIMSNSTNKENINATALMRDDYNNIERCIITAKDKYYGCYGNYIKIIFYYDSNLELGKIISTLNSFDDRYEYIVYYNCNLTDSDTKDVHPYISDFIKFVQYDTNSPVNINWLSGTACDNYLRLNPSEIYLQHGYSSMSILDGTEHKIYIIDTYSNKSAATPVNMKINLNPTFKSPSLYSLGL